VRRVTEKLCSLNSIKGFVVIGGEILERFTSWYGVITSRDRQGAGKVFPLPGGRGSLKLALALESHEYSP
jgi:hypothetical protein